jgi:hypothetical protein
MHRAVKYLLVSAGALLIVVFSSPAFAISADVAKKCGALQSAAFPHRIPGNPASGYTKGSASEAQAYFKECLANGGKPPNEKVKKDN